MATMTANPPAVPIKDEAWQDIIRKQIEAYLLPQVLEAKESFNQKLSEAPVDEVTREKLAKEHNDTLKSIRRIADDLFRDQIAQVGDRWAQGGQVELIYSGDLVEQQQAIMEQFQRKKLEGVGSRVSSPPVNVAKQGRQRSQWTPGESPTSDRDSEYFSRRPAPSYPDEDRPGRRSRNGSGASGYDPRFSAERMEEYSRSAIVDEPGEMDQPGRSYPEGSGSMRRQSNMGPRPPIPEFWRPSISPEEDAVMSKTYTLARRGSVASIGSNSYRSPSTMQFADRPEHVLARQGSVASMGPNSYRSPSATQLSERSEHRPVTRQGSITSIGSYPYRPPSTNQIPERPEPIHDDDDFGNVAALSERERSGIRAAEEEWSGMDKARERDRHGWKADHRYRSPNGTRTEAEYYASSPNPGSLGSSPVSAISPSAPLGSRPIEIPQRSHPSAPPAGRPTTNERSFSVDESGRHLQSSSPLSQGWAGPTPTPAESTASRSPPGAVDVARTQQPAHLRQRVSTQDLQHGHWPHVVRRQTFSKESQTPDLDNIDQLKEEQQRQAELAAHARRREEDARRKEEEARRMEEEAKRKEEEAQRKEEEAQRKEEEAQRKEAEARRRAEEAERLEKVAKAKEEAARLKEEETRRMEADIKEREKDLKRRELALERKIAEAQRKEEEKNQRELDDQRLEAERKEEDLRREAQKRREEEAEELEREDAIRLVQELERLDAEDKQREDEKQKMQEDFRRREEDIRLKFYQRRSQGEHEQHSAESTRPPPAKPSTSPPSTAPRPIPNRSGSAGNVSQTDRSGTSNSSYTSTSSRPNFKPSNTPTSSARTSASSTNSKPTSSIPRSTGFSGARAGTSSPTPEEIAEWNRRQEEQAQKQQDALAREQEQREKRRLLDASKGVNREDALKLFEAHERQWADLSALEWLNWYSFPWPLFSKPKSPDDLIPDGIYKYVLSHYQLGKKSSKSIKDHIKDHIKKWHPDRFETRVLPRIIQGDREKARAGAGLVARALNNLLRLFDES